jgi:phage terminase small subunit
MAKQLRRSDEITRHQRTFLLEKLAGLNDKYAALAAGYSLSVAENTKQRIWAKPGVHKEFDRLSDVENLRRQGLVRETELPDMVHKPTRVASLTKEGHKLLSRGKIVADDQDIYHGLKKPKEAFHDADL